MNTYVVGFMSARLEKKSVTSRDEFAIFGLAKEN